MNYEKLKPGFYKVIIREIDRIQDRSTIYLISIFLPLLLFTVTSFFYRSELIRELPVVVYDADNSSISRTIEKYVEATPTMKIVKYCSSLEEVKDEFRRGNAQGAFIFPPNFQKDIEEGKNSTVTIYQNSSNLIISNYVYNDGVKIVKTVSAGALLKKLQSKSLMYDQAMNIVNPIRLDTQILYNPNYSYETYLAPGLLIAFLQMIIMVVAALLLSSEYEHKTFEDLAESSNYNVWNIIFGKSIPHILIHMCTVLFMLGVIFNVFNIRYSGSVLNTIIVLFLFIVASFLFGIAISVVVKSQQTATEVSLFLNTPAFIFSGYTFPLWGMPLAHNIFAMIIPLTYVITAFMKLYYMGTPFRYVLPEIQYLSIFILVSLMVTSIILFRDLKKLQSGSKGVEANV